MNFYCKAPDESGLNSESFGSCKSNRFWTGLSEVQIFKFYICLLKSPLKAAIKTKMDKDRHR